MKPAARAQPKLHFVLDFDGVITNQHTESDVRLIRQLVALARHGHQIDIATGRPLYFTQEYLLPHLRKFCASDPKILDRFTLNGENGVDVARFHNGVQQPVEVHGKGLSLVQMRQLSNLVAASDFPNLTFDDKKRHVFSLYATGEQNKRDPAGVQADLTVLYDRLKPIVGKMSDVVLRRTMVAVDVQNPAAEKHLIGQRLFNESTSGKKFIVIGDSDSDLLIAKPLHKNQAKYEFFFVGPRKNLRRAVVREMVGYNARVKVSRKQYNEGTREVLRRFQR